jgi:hypothetical protein
MPVSYQAFCEITNFIRNNGEDWEEFRTRTAHTTRKAEKNSDPNFSKKRVGEYLKSGVGVDKADQIFALDTSF